MSKKQIEVRVDVVSNSPIYSYNLLEISKVFNGCDSLYLLTSHLVAKNYEFMKPDSYHLTEPKIISSRVTVEGLFVTLEYDDENYNIRRVIRSYNKIFYKYNNNNLHRILKYEFGDKVKITNPSYWFKTINDSGMLSEYYVVEYENKKYLFLDHLCGNREIFNIENDKVYKDFLNRKIPCDFKTDIYKKYLKDKDMTNSEWTIKEFKRNKMNYNFTSRMF